MLYQNVRARWCALALGVFSLNQLSPSIVKAQSKKLPPLRVAPKGEIRKTVAPVSAKAELVVQLSHGFGVTDVEFSPDSSLLASAGDDGAIKFWDTKTFELRQDLITGESDVLGGPKITFSADGKRLFSAGDTLKIWDISTGQPTTHFKIGSRAQSIEISPDGGLMALSLSDRLQIWSLKANPTTQKSSKVKGGSLLSKPSFKLLWSLKNQPYGQKSVSFSRSGRLAIGLPNEVRVVESRTGKLIQKFQRNSANLGNGQDAACVAFRPDGSLAMGLGSIQLWSGKVGEPAQKLPIEETSATNYLGFSRDGRLLLIRDDMLSTAGLRLFEMSTSRVVTTIAPDMPDIASAAISPDGKWVANGVSFNVFAAQLWNGQTGKLLRTWEGQNGGVNDVAVSANKRYLATATDDAPLRVWDTVSQKVKLMGTDAQGLMGVNFSSDSQLVANSEGEVWNLATGKLQRRLAKKDEPAFASEIPIVARKTKKPFLEADGDTEQLALSPDGKLMATAVNDWNEDKFNAVLIWDADTGAILHRLTSVGSGAYSVCFSRNGNFLIAGYGDGSIRFWNTKTWKLQQALPAHTGSVNSVKFTSDGKHFLSAGNDYRIKIWDSTSGALQATLVILPPSKKQEISKDWLLYTHNGYYDGSPGAEKWMRWRVGNQLHPASYGRYLRKSNLLKSVLQ